ncbi:hypothetical protein IW262DRAFT_1398060, partial [Armillaria fumosa]
MRSFYLTSTSGLVWLVSIAIRRWRQWNDIALYGIPQLELTYWFIVITHLYHMDPALSCCEHGRFQAWSTWY